MFLCKLKVRPVFETIYNMIRWIMSAIVLVVIWTEIDGDWFYDIVFPMLLMIWFIGLIFSQAHNRPDPFLCFIGIWKRWCDWGFNKARENFILQYPDKYCPPAAK